MTRASHTAFGIRRHALWMRVAAAAVLVGYGMTLGATSAGHGFRLMAHLAGEHHERLEALLFGAGTDEAQHSKLLSGCAQEEANHAGSDLRPDCPPQMREAARAPRSGAPAPVCAPTPSDAMGAVAGGSGHAEAHEHPEAHEHAEAHERAGAHERAEAHEQREAHERAEVEPLPSAFHSHRGSVHSHHEEPPPPALVTISLDKHCLAPRPVVPAPGEARAVEPAAPFEALAFVVLSVEVRPPQRSA